MASGSKIFSLSDVSEHTTKKDLYMVVHERVYDVSGFVDEHPGGEEVMLNVSGQDATEVFEDVGHSDEAHRILEGLFVGKLKRGANDPSAPSIRTNLSSKSKASANAAGLGIGVYAVILISGAAAYFTYQYLQQQSTSQS